MKVVMFTLFRVGFDEDSREKIAHSYEDVADSRGEDRAGFRKREKANSIGGSTERVADADVDVVDREPLDYEDEEAHMQGQLFASTVYYDHYTEELPAV